MKKLATCGFVATVVTASAFYAETTVNLQTTSPGTTQVGHLHISGTAITGGVQGYSPTTTGIAYGGDFRSVSNQGRGVLGNASSLTGATYGGLFQAASIGGRGIAGIASATTGTTYGGFFTTFSNQGRAVYGEAKATSGLAVGVWGKTNSPAGFAGYFEGGVFTTGTFSGSGAGLNSLNANGITSGTLADARLTPNVPLLNTANTFTANTSLRGLFQGAGPRTAAIGTGEVFGISSNNPSWGGTYVTTPNTGMPYFGMDNIAHRAYMYLDTDGSYRLHGGGTDAINIGPTGNLGVQTPEPAYPLDVTVATTDAALYVQNGNVNYINNPGRCGIFSGSNITSTTSFAQAGGFVAKATGGASAYGVVGSAYGDDTAMGVEGDSDNEANHYAGFFRGLLYAKSATSSVKSFLIDHPLDPANKYLEHSSVESDQRMDVYRGIVTTDSTGHATVTLPNWFSALNTDIQYVLTVIDTTDSDSFVLAKIVKKYDGKSFRIRTSAPNVEVHWQANGRRHDPSSEYFPLEVEHDKVGSMRGKYLLPEAYGKDPSMGIGSEVMTRTGKTQTPAKLRPAMPGEPRRGKSSK
jgi:hypothetical protein